MFLRMTFGLLPSFRPGHTKLQRLHPTSYLDGLRGVASFIVFMGHYTEENFGWYTEPYGAYEDGARSSPLQLPFIRVVYSARPMVHIFFIISGYVLCYKPLKQIHSQQYSALANTLSSSVFRRAIRLFLPSFVTLLVMAISLCYGFSDTRYAERQLDLASQLHHVLHTCLSVLGSSWRLDSRFPVQPAYNPALWTIPVEFSQSLLLFVVLLGLSRCLPNFRLLLLSGIIAFCFYSGQLFTVEFLGGLFLAEVTLLNDHSLTTPSSSPATPTLPIFTFDKREESAYVITFKQRCTQAFWFANLISGLFIASWTNDHIDKVWGLRFLNAHTPHPYEGQAVWFCLGAFQIVAACTQLPCLQRLFTTCIPQYLGSISYALYLMHNLCLTILEPRFVPLFDQVFDKATFWGRQVSWLAGLLVFVPVVIWVADLFWRVVDTPTVRFARWFEGKCVVDKKS